jgi:hypothetical protein
MFHPAQMEFLRNFGRRQYPASPSRHQKKESGRAAQPIHDNGDLREIQYYREFTTVTTPFFWRGSTNSDEEFGTRQKNRWHFLDLGAF